MRTLLKTLLVLIILAMVGGYAYQAGRIDNPGKTLGGLFGSDGDTPKTIQILDTDQQKQGTVTTHKQDDDDTKEDTDLAERCLLPEAGSSCTTPRGEQLIHGKAVVSYQVNSDGQCQSKVSVCNDGNYLADEKPYGLAECPTNALSGATGPLGCQFGDVIIPAGQTITLYTTAIRDGDDWSCNAQERTCTEGTLDGDTEYSQMSCYSPSSAFCQLEATNEDSGQADPEPVRQETTTQPTQQIASQPVSNREPNCPSPFGGKARHPGQQGTAYSASSVSFGNSCESVSIVCSYGSIRYGTAANPGTIVQGTLATSCEVTPPADCESSCGAVDHGSTITTYKRSIMPHGNGQVCDDEKIISTCTNGTLSPSDGGSCSCQIAPPADCTAPNGQRVAHEGSLTLYQYPQVIAVPGDGSDTCIRQWRQCINGGFYDWNGARADFTYQHPTCSVVPPPEGGGPGGDGVPTT